jgi:GyrI-like small molecule binding protein
MADAEPARLVERNDVAVMFKRVADEQTAISRGWAEVEEAVGSLRGRKFYGVFDGASGEYRVCVQLRDEDEPAALGLETGTLPGGRYAQVRLQGEPPAVYERIAPTFERLAQRPDHDPSRPGIEFYRRRDVIDLLLPVS